jgi:hypothetical protein
MLGRDGTWRSLLLPEMEVTGPSFNTEAEVVIHEMSELHKLATSNRVYKTSVVNTYYTIRLRQ